MGFAPEKSFTSAASTVAKWYFMPARSAPIVSAARWNGSNPKATAASIRSPCNIGAPTPDRQSDMPIALGIVEMDEGFHLFTEFLAADLASLEIGLSVSASYHEISDELVLPKFEPTPQPDVEKGLAS